MLASERAGPASYSGPCSGDEQTVLHPHATVLKSNTFTRTSPSAPPLKRQCTPSGPTCMPTITTHSPFSDAPAPADFSTPAAPTSFLSGVPERASGAPAPQLFSSTPAEAPAPVPATPPQPVPAAEPAATAAEQAPPLERLISTFGVDQVPAQEAGALGQVILVASRLGAYCRAAWYLLVAAGEAPDADGTAPPAEGAAPFARYCEVLKLLMRHSILRRVQALHVTALRSAADSRALLQHVLLWQYLRRRNVMDLVAIMFERRAAAAAGSARAPAAASGGCFLTTLGVELIQEAMQQAKGTVQVPQVAASADGSTVERCGPLQDVDMERALAAVYTAANARCPSSSEDSVASLSGDEGALHRVTAFLAQHHALVTQVLAGLDHTPGELHELYLALAHASTLLMPVPKAPESPPGSGSGSGSNDPAAAAAAAATVVVVETPSAAAAAAAVARYNTSVEACHRAAKAAILDARIAAARGARWNADVSACSVKAAVSKAFRKAYLWPELKQLLNAWGPIVDGAVDSEALMPEASIGACAAAAAAFDASPLGIRFRVPSAGFMLVWVTAPTSPAHAIGRQGELGVLLGGGGASGGVHAVRSDGALPDGGGDTARMITRAVQSCAAVQALAGGGSRGKGVRRRRTDSCPTVHTIIRGGSTALNSSWG